MIALFDPNQGKMNHTSLPEDAENSLHEVLAKRVGLLDDEMIAQRFEGRSTANDVLDKALSWQNRGIIKLGDAVVASRGNNDQIIKDVSDELRPDTSVLFLLGKSLDPRRLRAELSALDTAVITTSLSEEQRAYLYELLEGNA